MRLQRAALTGKYVTYLEREVGDVSDVLYHDDEKVAVEEAVEEKKQLLKIKPRG